MKDLGKIQAYIKSYYEDYYRINVLYLAWAEVHGIQDTTLFVLNELYEHPEGMTQRELVAYLGYPKQTVSYILRKLEEEDIIVRKKDCVDRRSNRVTFTPKGKVYAQGILQAMRRAEVEAFWGMTEEEQEKATQGLKCLADALEKSFHKNQI